MLDVRDAFLTISILIIDHAAVLGVTGRWGLLFHSQNEVKADSLGV